MKTRNLIAKRSFRKKSCAGKTRYYSSAAASKALKTEANVYGVTGLHSYRCEFGGHLHLGH